MWVAVINRCWVEGKKEASAGGWLPAGPTGLSTSYSLRHRNQKPKVSVEACTTFSHPLPGLNRGPKGERRGIAWDAWDAHTRESTWLIHTP